MQVSALLLRWGSYRWARNLWVLIVYLFFLSVMLPSVVPRLTTDSAVRVFSGVWKLLSLLRLPFQDGALSREWSLKKREVSKHQETLSLLSLW